MNSAILGILVVLAYVGVLLSVEDPEEFPNLLAGSFTDGGKFSTGNTLPLVGRPWGFNHWAPQTRERNRYTGSWWFSGSDQHFTWLRCTHQPSPWIGDWGYFHFTPMIGQISHTPTYFWNPRSAYIKPHVFDAVVAPNNLRMQLSPTDHGAFLKVTFPAGRDSGEKHVCFVTNRFTSDGSLPSGGHFITGEATSLTNDRILVNNLALRLRVESPESNGIENVQDLKCFKYPRDITVVNLRIATSLISPEQCLLNMQRELQGKSYEDIYQESKLIWNQMLRRVNILDAEKGGMLTGHAARSVSIFYTSLYRALTFPRRLEEVDSRGKVVHYSPYDRSGQVHEGVLVTDNGLWDTFRTVYPLLSLAFPDHLGNIVQGWLNAYKEGGWLPSWASPGYRNCMVGTFGDVVIADALVKGVKCFEQSTAIEALKKDALEEGPGYAGGAVGKTGLGQYKGYGYLPSEEGGEVVSRTLDYGFADYSTAQAFAHVAAETHNVELENLAKELESRAVKAYTSLFDRDKGLMVPKDKMGRAPGRWSSVEWGNGYTEGNAWHHSFPPYAITCADLSTLSADTEGKSSYLRSSNTNCNGGLASLYGGKSGLLKKLHELLDTPSVFQFGSYRQEIHEMTESRAVAMGQYAHNNQPVHHLLYLFASLGEPETTQRTVREILERAYGEDFYAGDEDNGEMGAWFVLSALGVYSITPGTPEYILSSPLFRHVRISWNNEEGTGSKASPPCSPPGGYLDIFALGTRREVYKVKWVEYNSSVLKTFPRIHSDLVMKGGVLRFVMDGEEESKGGQDGKYIETMHRMPTKEIEEWNRGEGRVDKAGKGEKEWEKKVLEQQELIDQLQKEISKEKAQAHYPPPVFIPPAVLPAPTPLFSFLPPLVALVCYGGLLLVALLTVLITLKGVCALYEGESRGTRLGSALWGLVGGLVGGLRGWLLWIRIKLGGLGGGEGGASKPSAYTV